MHGEHPRGTPAAVPTRELRDTKEGKCRALPYNPDSTLARGGSGLHSTLYGLDHARFEYTRQRLETRRSLRTSSPTSLPQRRVASLSSSKVGCAGSHISPETRLTANEVYKRLEKSLDKNDHVLIIKVDPDDKQGWLPNDAWGWINNRAA